MEPALGPLEDLDVHFVRYDVVSREERETALPTKLPVEVHPPFTKLCQASRRTSLYSSRFSTVSARGKGAASSAADTVLRFYRVDYCCRESLSVPVTAFVALEALSKHSSEDPDLAGTARAPDRGTSSTRLLDS